MSWVKHSTPEFQRIADEHTILRCQVGSGVHGTAIAGTDDRDEMGICREPPEYVVGLQHFEQYVYRTQPEGVRSGPGDLDLTIYGLRKWMRLAVGGNPTVLLPLFVPPEEILSIDLDVAEEEFVAVIGRSGCGKSTLLRVIAGLLPVRWRVR